MIKILITGSNGLVGQHLIPHLLSNDVEVIATGQGPARIASGKAFRYCDLDITDFRATRELIKQESPDVLIHSAAMTSVDECELNREKCRLINVTATENLLDAAAASAPHFIFLSTDFVFDGKKGNYREEDPVNPVNWYGETKVMGEQLVSAYTGHWSIARTCLLYGIVSGSSRTNIISWIISALKKQERIRVVNDQVRTPTAVKDFAAGIGLILSKRAGGCFHLSGKEIMTPYEMAMQTAGYFSLDKSLIIEADATSFTQAGRRPLKTGFVIEKAESLLGFSPVSFEEGLRALDLPEQNLK